MVVAHETVRQLSCVVARISVIEAGGTFEHSLTAADIASLRQSDGEHGAPHRGAFAKRTAFEVAPRQVGA